MARSGADVGLDFTMPSRQSHQRVVLGVWAVLVSLLCFCHFVGFPGRKIVIVGLIPVLPIPRLGNIHANGPVGNVGPPWGSVEAARGFCHAVTILNQRLFANEDNKEIDKHRFSVGSVVDTGKACGIKLAAESRTGQTV